MFRPVQTCESVLLLLIDAEESKIAQIWKQLTKQKFKNRETKRKRKLVNQKYEVKLSEITQI